MGNACFISRFALGICLMAMFPLAHASLEAGIRAKERGHYATAIRAWKVLAKEGDARAQNNIGHMYEEGLGVAQNYAEAMKWNKKSSESR